jgi:hypothetical protein
MAHLKRKQTVAANFKLSIPYILPKAQKWHENPHQITGLKAEERTPDLKLVKQKCEPSISAS